MQAPKGKTYDWARLVASRGVRAFIAEIGEDTDTRADLARVARPLARRVAALMSAGYRRAERRWPWQMSALRMFETIAEAVSRCHAFKSPEDGAPLRLYVDYDEFTATCEEAY